MRRLLITLLVMPFGVFAQQAAWKNIDQTAYKLSYPGDWVLDEGGQMGTRFILFSALESTEDLFKENVNLIIQDLTGYNLDLDKYAQLSENQIKSMITNVNIIEHKRVSTGAVPHYKIIYTGDQGAFKLTFEQYYFVKDNKAYVLTFTSEQKNFEKYKADGEKILESFALKG